MILSVALVFGAVVSCAGIGSTYADSVNVFSVTIPEGWSAESARYSVTHYRDVFFCVNNRARNLRISDPPNGGSISDLARNLPRGTVYMDFAHFEGPGRSAMFGPGRDDTFDAALKEFARNPQPRQTHGGVDYFELNFIRWGSNWSVWILGRRPYAHADLQDAFEILRSLQFAELPITSTPQAVKAAMEKLPASAVSYDPRAGRDDCFEDGWLANDGRRGQRETRVQRQGTDFKVVFRLYATGNSNDIAGEWKYLVHRNGLVTPQQ